MIKSKLNFLALSSYKNFCKDKNPPGNLTNHEFQALKDLINNKNIVIQKADKGNIVVILDKTSYTEKVGEILKDLSKFEKIEIPHGKDINYIINLEKKFKSIIKPLFDNDIIDKSTYKFIQPVGSKPGVLYGLAKVHKKLLNESKLLSIQ